MRRPRSPSGAGGPTRPWTRTGALATGAHVGIELLGGVAVPLASRFGLPRAAAGHAAAVLAVHEAARRAPASWDPVLAAANGAYAAMVLAHHTSWPRTRRGGLPWLLESEGLTGRVMVPYNLVLHVSAVAAVGGLAENRRGLWAGLLSAAVLAPWLRREAPREYHRLLVQARVRPRWWNRRLQRRPLHQPGR